MTKDEALKLALEALERSVATCFDRYAHEQVMSRPEHFINQAITAIKESLAQPEQEPFGYFKVEPFGWTDCAETDEGARALYEAPLQPEERYFCPRCGKRTADLTTIHTCTPPRENT